MGVNPGRVRVAVRLRPRNAEDLLSDADFADCVELQPEEQEEISELRLKLQQMYQLHGSTVNELQSLKAEYKNQVQEKETITEELYALGEKLSAEEKRRKTIDYELVKLKNGAPEGDNDFEDKISSMKENWRGTSVFGISASLNKSGLRGLELQRYVVKKARLC